MLKNKTKNTIIASKVKFANSFFKKFKGLMLESKVDYALIFILGHESKLSASIHMLFMKIPIDVLFLDKNKVVVDSVKGLKPWTLNYTPKKAASYIIELPINTIKSSKISINDKLNWEE